MSSNSWCYVEDGVPIYRLSSIGSCITSLVAARNGESATPPGEALRRSFDQSSSVEDDILELVAVELANGGLIWQQHRVELKVPILCRCHEQASGFKHDVIGEHYGASVICRGHLDALHQQSDTIIEAKALGDTYFDRWNHGGMDALGSLGLKYRWQAAGYGHAAGRQVRFAIGHKRVREDGSVVIDDLILEPPMDAEALVPLTEFQARVRQIEEHAYQDVYPDCDRNCRPGDAYSHVHLFPAPNLADMELTDMVMMEQELDVRLSALQKERDDIRTAIKAAHAPGKYLAGPFTLHLIEKTPTRFDSSGFRKAHPEMYEEWKKPGRTYTEYRVTGGKRDKEDTDD